jgi:hypothetical protein
VVTESNIKTVELLTEFFQYLKICTRERKDFKKIRKLKYVENDAINYYKFYKLLQRRKYDKMGEYLYLMQCYSAKTIEETE